MSVRRVLVLGAVWLVVSSAVCFAPGCYARNCEASVEIVDPDLSQASMLDANSWESNPVDGDWLWFPRQRYYTFHIPELGGRTPKNPIPYLSAHREGPRSGGTATLGSGNIAVMPYWGANRVDVKNDTCSDYYLRLYLDVPELPPDPRANDAGTNEPRAVSVPQPLSD